MLPQVPVIIETVGAGTITAGAASVAVLNIGAADGLFDGGRVPAGTSLTYPYIGRQYGEIAYNAGGTEFLIRVFK